jgi:predicted ATP-dependent endonuclease of OLD family
MPSKQKYIKDFRLSGYKSIKNVTCEFEEGLNIIIGNNGSGKSNLLEFVYKILKRDYSGLDIFDAIIDFYSENGSFPEGNLSENKIYNWHTEGYISKKGVGFEEIQVDDPLHHDFLPIDFVRFNSPKVIDVLSHELNAKYNFKSKRFLLDSSEENIPEILTFWLRNVFNKTYLENIKLANELTDILN